ncbi:MAG: GH3 auxin-responsive promoter family protein, partial [Bacteroidota bacterium]
FPKTELIEFSVAPNVTPKEGLPLHEWYIEFAREPEDLKAFEKLLDSNLVNINTYYEDLITGSILRPLKVMKLKKDAFRSYMKSQGKLGGQNKVPRLSNDRKIADQLNDLGLVEQ